MSIDDNSFSETKPKKNKPKHSFHLSLTPIDLTKEINMVAHEKKTRLRRLSLNIFSFSSRKKDPDECQTCAGYESKKSKCFRRFLNSMDLKKFKSKLNEGIQEDPMEKLIFQRKCTHVAEQICLMDKSLFKKIKWKELNKGNWVKKKYMETECKNVVNVINFSNKIGNLAISEIVFREKLESRVKALTFYIKLANKLLEYGNLNSSRIIVGALQNYAIFRLTETWAGLKNKHKKIFEYLDNFYDLSTKENEYYKIVEYAYETGDPLIPFLGNFLTKIMSAISLNEITQFRTTNSKSSSNNDETINTISSGVTIEKSSRDLASCESGQSEATEVLKIENANSSHQIEGTPPPSDQMDEEKTSQEFGQNQQKTVDVQEEARKSHILNSRKHKIQSLLTIQMNPKISLKKFCSSLNLEGKRGFSTDENREFDATEDYHAGTICRTRFDDLKDEFKKFKKSSQRYEFDECKNIQTLIRDTCEYEEKILDYQSALREPHRR